ncbi:hypothetical protein Acsp02_93590 [Actinoplanes sp. NBRC 103695]|nr:hypothetical protein Acsp02_93590 [Actinoplanes sp. NBRC 103695]
MLTHRIEQDARQGAVSPAADDQQVSERGSRQQYVGGPASKDSTPNRHEWLVTGDLGHGGGEHSPGCRLSVLPGEDLWCPTDTEISDQRHLPDADRFQDCCRLIGVAQCPLQRSMGAGRPVDADNDASSPAQCPSDVPLHLSAPFAV